MAVPHLRYTPRHLSEIPLTRALTPELVNTAASYVSNLVSSGLCERRQLLGPNCQSSPHRGTSAVRD
jgi:hypothetical protein